VIDYGIVIHGGVGSAAALTDGCKAAGATAFNILRMDGPSLDAVVEAVRILEDDGRFNAGKGSLLRIDGITVEMDAAVMNSLGRIGSVINIRNVSNPVLLARAVMDTPHVALAGRGAERFAKKLGFAELDHIKQVEPLDYARVLDLINNGKLGDINPLWKEVNISLLRKLSCDTVGAVALDKEGVFAVAVSTGGASPMMLGRVGDTPLVGCGFYAGESGAVATTGIGEEIIRRMLAKTVYDLLAGGQPCASACDFGISLFPSEIGAGVIGMSKEGVAMRANKHMAHYLRVCE
jgi:beta-aspartyl-peptidase (threonine type)